MAFFTFLGTPLFGLCGFMDGLPYLKGYYVIVQYKLAVGLSQKHGSFLK